MNRLAALALAGLCAASCSDEASSPTHSPPPEADYRAMTAWFAERGITLPSTPPPGPRPAAKVAQDSRILGDGSGDGLVNFWDAWSLFQHLTDGHTFDWFDLDAFDINRNGAADWIDLGLLGDYLYGSKANPHGIGQPMAPAVTASIDPSPRSVTFVADGEDWKKFTVRVTGGATVKVAVNRLSLDGLSLEIHKGRSAPNRSFCPAERNDSKTVVDGDIIWIAGCTPGNSSIFILDEDGNFLEENWSIDVVPAADASFDIELVFVGNQLTARDKLLARQAADRWESIITEGVEDLYVDLDTRDFPGDWLDFSALGEHLQIQQTVDDLLVYVGVAGSEWYAVGGAFWVTQESRPILGQLSLSPAALAETDALTENIFLHELGHILGIGGSRWEELIGASSENSPTADTYLFGAGARSAFDRVGGRNYQGNKVPVENGGDDSHWRESVFDSELMSSMVGDSPEPLSEVTLHALDDLGFYQIDVSQAEPYTLPPVAKPVARRETERRCKVLRLPPGAQAQ